MVSLRRTTRGTVLVINPQFHDSHHQHGTNHFSNSFDFQQQLSQPNSWNYHCTHQICQHCYKGEVEPRFWCYHPQGLSIKWPKLGAHRAKTESKPWSMDVRTNLSPHLSSKQVTIYLSTTRLSGVGSRGRLEARLKRLRAKLVEARPQTTRALTSRGLAGGKCPASQQVWAQVSGLGGGNT